MSRAFTFTVAAFALLSSGCTETPVSAPLRSLEGSQDVAFVCVGPGGEGRWINDCPDREDDDRTNRLYALVTQEKGELAVIDLHAGFVVDADPSTPGFTFLHIGGDPRDIVSTPGGEASFVGVAEVGKEGIFAIPSSCLGAPGPGQSGRDLTTWPACSLPAAPGSMAVLIDPPDPSGNVRERCPLHAADPDATPTSGAETAGRECPADLTTEPGPVGRRKLAVALPELGRIDIFDAQALVNRVPGSFQPCDLDLEASIPLRVDLPTRPVEQRLPEDLVLPGCVAPALNHGPRPEVFEPQPSGFALGGDVLYVGDRRAPVIHVLDVADPCAVAELPVPLLPVSYQDPNRVVITSELALSDTTTTLQRFLYAVDVTDPDGSSVMVFDVTAGATDRTPLVRPGTARLNEPPDRIRFASEAIASVAFGRRDLPQVDENEISTNPFCDPNPAITEPDPAAKYRPSPDRSSGAAPGNLRGIFAFVALKSGQVMVVDVEDYDAACRRPTGANPGATENFQGCKNDPDVGEFVIEGTPTVTDEVSCRIVQPHLARSGSFVLTDENAVRAPSLRTLPRFTAPGESNPDRTAFPQLLATALPDRPAQVYVGTDRFTTDPNAESNTLDIDPATAEEHSLTLPWVEPRSYIPVDEQTLVFEGTFTFRTSQNTSARITGDQSDRFVDPSNGFCNAGVQDRALAREWGVDLGLTREQDLVRFERDHADVVQITAEVLDPNESYWQSEKGAACADGQGYFGCVDLFGAGAQGPIVANPCPAPVDLREERELIVREAYNSELVFEPKTENPEESERILANIGCCFPSVVSYRIRGGNQWILTGTSGFRRNMTTRRESETDSRLRCVEDCRPQRALQKSRAIEIPLDWGLEDAPKEVPDANVCDPNAGALCPACSVPIGSTMTAAVVPDRNRDPRAACIFESIVARFAVYAGRKTSERDMCFSWVANGGFNPLSAKLTSQTFSISPVSMTFVPQIGQLAVVDGSAAGLVFVSLESIGVSRLFF